ncbi:hypothetical protein K501DRAFT_329521 [Backusella circina FSU 941]|nr:hypothetical protein K501DRAFT_329521 [Backusella circina FSU 941]
MSNKSKDPFRTPSPKLEVEKQPPSAPRPSRTRSSIKTTKKRLQDANVTPSNLTNRFERVQSSSSLTSTSSSLVRSHSDLYATHLFSLYSSDSSSVDTEHSEPHIDVGGAENETRSVHSEESNDSSHSGDSSDSESISFTIKQEVDPIDAFFATPNIDTTPTPTNEFLPEKDLLGYIHSGDDVSSRASTASYASIPHIQPEPWAQRLRPRTHFAPVTYSLKYLTYYTDKSKRSY